MSDLSIKEQKLAAARKKLRKFQKQKTDTFPKLSRSGQSSPLDFLNSARETLSSASSVTDISESGASKKSKYDENDLDNTACNSNFRQEILSDDNKIIQEPTSNFIEESPMNSSQPVPYLIQNEQQVLNPLSNNSKPIELYQESGISEVIRETISRDNYNVPLSSSSTNLFEPSYESPDNEGSICSETDASLTTVIQRKPDGCSVYQSQDTSLKSTTESLRQLSLQISGLVNDADIHDPSRQELTIMELEKRNNELASLLENEKQKSMENTSLIEELKRSIDSQNIQIQGFQRMSITGSNGTEVNGLREQLQVHIQTIGILVAEKSELQMNLSHTRYALEQKAGEITDLHGRLDAAREHIKGTDSSLQDLRNQHARLTETKDTNSQQLNNMQTNYSKLSKLCDEMRATTAELTERLAVRTEENKKLNTEITEVRREYELAQVHVEQLKTNSTEDLRKQYEDLQNSYTESLHQINVAKASVEQAEKEKRQMEQEYKSYASQLAADLEDVKDKLLKETKKGESLAKRNEELQSELKAREDDLQLGALLDDVTKERDKLIQELKDISQIKIELDDRCSTLVRDNGQLSQYLSEISAKYEALEAAVDRNNTYQVDTSQLLQSMQSDKVAASRALTQNKQLKEQLEELQNGFVMMSNKKLELTEKLERELHIKKGLFKEISQLGDELGTYKQELLTKQRQIERLKGNKTIPEFVDMGSVNGTHHHDEYEQDHHNDQHDHHHHHDNHDHHHDHHDRKSEQDQEKLASEDSKNGVHHSKYEQKPIESDRGGNRLISSNSEEVDNSEEVPLRIAHKALELKFLKCMEKLALLSDEKQELEHLVQQLELETETVGDYITIYQFQRGVMKQQMQELKFELDLLRTDKLDTSNKLTKLQKLIEGLSENKSCCKEGLIKGVESIMNTNSIDNVDNNQDNRNHESEKGEEETATAGTHEAATPPQEHTKNETVKQIMELLSEMESASQLDISTFNRIHPCSHCSGKLITI